jgi:ribosomal protein L37AE/L43A
MERKTRGYHLNSCPNCDRTNSKLTETDNGLRTCVFCRHNLDGSGVARDRSLKEENGDGKEASEGDVTKINEKKDKEGNVAKVEEVGEKK